MTRPHGPIPARYTDERDKHRFVRQLFDRGAPHYDRIGCLGSLGTGHLYRKQALRRAGLQPGMTVLDVACGTGAVTRAVQALLGKDGRVVGIDPSPGMLAQAKTRLRAEFLEACAESLPFPDDSFDFLTMGYALRHVEDLQATFVEYHRVLRTDGRLLLLEITKPRHRLGQLIARFYLRDFLPFLARITGGSRPAQAMMTYYWETIDACAPPETILTALRETGFRQVTRHVDLGVFSEYRGVRP